MALRFIAGAEGKDFKRPEKSVSGAELGMLTTLVIERFIEQVEWDDVMSIYLTGLVDDEDLSLIQRAVKAIVAGGVQINV